MAWQQQWHRRKFVPYLNFDSCTVKLLQHNHDVEKRENVGIAMRLLKKCIDYARRSMMREFRFFFCK
jgi:hypothetical protein